MFIIVDQSHRSYTYSVPVRLCIVTLFFLIFGASLGFSLKGRQMFFPEREHRVVIVKNTLKTKNL